MKYLQTVKAPLFFLCLFVIFHLFSKNDLVPSFEELSIQVEHFFNEYGLFAVAILSVIENIVGVNAYFPGSIVILTAMALTAGNPILGALTFLTIFLFACISYNINYFIGKSFGTTRKSNNKKKRLSTNIELWGWYLGTFWHPHFTAITCLITGSEGFPYRWFLKHMIVAGSIWNIFWALTMYNFGVIAKSTYNMTAIMYVYFLGWLLIDSIKYLKNAARTKK